MLAFTEDPSFVHDSLRNYRYRSVLNENGRSIIYHQKIVLKCATCHLLTDSYNTIQVFVLHAAILLTIITENRFFSALIASPKIFINPWIKHFTAYKSHLHEPIFNNPFEINSSIYRTVDNVSVAKEEQPIFLHNDHMYWGLSEVNY